jgi:hypothetical protein
LGPLALAETTLMLQHQVQKVLLVIGVAGADEHVNDEREQVDEATPAQSPLPQ